MLRLLKDHYFWFIAALAVLLGIQVYVADPSVLSWLPIGEELTDMAFEHSQFLVLLGAVAIAAWRFGVIGGLTTSFAVGLLLFAHLFLEKGHPAAWLETGFIFTIAIIFSWLIGTQTKVKRRLQQDAEALQRQTGELNREITERKRAKEKLKQTVAKLERSNTELQQFAYVASHDLQEPLRMVSSFTQLLKRRYQGKLDKDADEFIAYAVDGANRMQRMINDLLTYSRVGTRGKEFQPTDCEAVFDQALDNLQIAIEETGATITHDPLPTVIADETQLIQLFQNLLGNAIKFHGQEPPRVHVSAEQRGKEWVFSVRDNGIGIAPEFHEQVFVIFHRLQGKEYPGTGIGLAICHKIVERHGGRIWVESESGKGSVFYFTMPAKGGKKP